MEEVFTQVAALLLVSTLVQNATEWVSAHFSRRTAAAAAGRLGRELSLTPPASVDDEML